MKKISRKKFFYFITSLSLSYPLSLVIASSRGNKLGANGRFPITIDVIKAAYQVEKVASKKYIRYSRKAVEEKYPNIAYLFTALAASEKIHAKNYKRILTALNAGPEEPEFEILLLDTKVRKYSKIVFSLVAKKIEGMKFDFHVCEICGSTLNEAPKAPCEICNFPKSHYDKVIRPT